MTKAERHEPPDDDEIEGEDEPEAPPAPEPAPIGTPPDAPKPDASGPWGRDVKE